MTVPDRSERRYTLVTGDPFDEQFLRTRGCRYKYFAHEKVCHFVVSDLDLEAWQAARGRFLQTVAASSPS